MLMASSSAGLWSERTRWGAAVSSPLVTMLLTITLCNVGVLPPASPAYDTVNQVKADPTAVHASFFFRVLPFKTPCCFRMPGPRARVFAADAVGVDSPVCFPFASVKISVVS